MAPLPNTLILVGARALLISIRPCRAARTRLRDPEAGAGSISSRGRPSAAPLDRGVQYIELCQAAHCVGKGRLGSLRGGYSLSQGTGSPDGPRAASSEQQRSARVPRLGPQGRAAEPMPKKQRSSLQEHFTLATRLSRDDINAMCRDVHVSPPACARRVTRLPGRQA